MYQSHSSQPELKFAHRINISTIVITSPTRSTQSNSLTLLFSASSVMPLSNPSASLHSLSFTTPFTNLPLTRDHRNNSQLLNTTSQPFPYTLITPRRARRTSSSPCCHSSPSSDQAKVWNLVKTSIPLSQVFSDRLGTDALHSVTTDKYKIVCPFHNDVNPSLQIDNEKALFYCFGCGASGSLIDAEILFSGNSSIGDALRSLAARYPPISNALGLSQNSTATPASTQVSQRVGKKQKAIPRRVTLAQATVARASLREIVQQYQQVLWDPATPAALNYCINERGLSETTLRAFGCGYAPPSRYRNYALTLLQEAGHEPHHAVLAGIARQSRNASSGIRDIFTDRFITPIRDLSGDTIALAGRVLPNAGDKEPKYVNSPETTVFKKKNTLFGTDIAVKAPSAKSDNGYILIVEGYMDVMTIFEHTQGRIACVASMGTALSKKQLETAYDLLHDPADGRVIVNMDNDDAGIAALERLCENVFPTVSCPYAIHIASPPPPAKDPDEFLRSVGMADEYIMYLLHTARPWYEWLGDRIVLLELERMYKDAEESPSVEENQSTPMRRTTNQSSSTFDSVYSEFLRQQRDNMLISFGAPTDFSNESKKKGKVASLPDVSEEVIEKLAKIVATAKKCVPGVNAGALIKSWADTLSRSHPAKLVSIYSEIVARCDKLCEPWRDLSIPAMVDWMSPAPWVVDELPKDKQRAVRRDQGYDPNGETMDFDTFVTNPKRLQRSIEKMKHQENTIIPAIMEQRCESAKLLKIAPRQSAEELLLRTLISAQEIDRLDALQALLEIILRCNEKKLPFWTSHARHELFEYLAGVEGPTSPEEMMAYLEEMDWWSEELEKLFLSADEETDREWRELRRIENKNPTAVVTAVGTSIETMSGKVASRMALEQSEEILEQLLEEAIANNNTAVVKELLEKQTKLSKDIDNTNFLNPQDLKQRNEIFAELQEQLDKEQMVRNLLEEVEGIDDKKVGDATL